MSVNFHTYPYNIAVTQYLKFELYNKTVCQMKTGAYCTQQTVVYFSVKLSFV